MKNGNNSEPAFPVTENIGLNGLTKREWLAAIIGVAQDVDGYSESFLVALVGRPIPSIIDPLEVIKWNCEAEAKLRVMKADALLSQLSTTQP